MDDIVSWYSRDMDDIRDIVRREMADWRAMPAGPEKDRRAEELQRRFSAVIAALDQLIDGDRPKN